MVDMGHLPVWGVTGMRGLAFLIEGRGRRSDHDGARWLAASRGPLLTPDASVLFQYIPDLLRALEALVFVFIL